MTIEIFGPSYAGLYDVVYAEKDYDQECEAILEAVARFGPDAATRLLDLGCGTGQHAVRLAKHGFDVTGVDISSAMLDLARRRAHESGTRISLHQGDVRHLAVDDTFDVAVMMFAVLGYQSTNEDVLSTLRGARRALATGGLLVFDAWYGPAVLKLHPERRLKSFRAGDQEITRESSATVDSYRQLCDVDIRLTTEQSDGTEELIHEVHRMRYFFANEIQLFLECSGFELAGLGPFPSVDRELTDEDWNLICVARAGAGHVNTESGTVAS